MIVNSYQEAETLYSASTAECREHERSFQDAIAEIEQAVWRYQMARTRLTMAEFRVGRARNVIRKSGFEDVLHIRSRVNSPNSMSSSCLSPSRNDWSLIPLRKSASRTGSLSCHAGLKS
jgi:hypothetical protein